MPDDIPSNESIDKWVRHQPLDVIEMLPGSSEQREAKRLINAAADLAHQCRERVQPE